MGVTSFLLLSCLGLTITARAQDCLRPVEGPNMDFKSSDAFLQSFPDGIRVSFSCNPGYMSAGGTPTITCIAGTWSTLTLTCERRSCGSVGEVANGQIDYSEGIEFGDKAVVICDDGYRVIGKNEVVCGVQGWEGRLPICEAVICDPPPAVTFGTFSPDKETYKYRDVVQFTCQKDYTLDGSNSATCSGDGTFQPDPPTCNKIECAEPDIENAEWTGGSRPLYGYKDKVTYQCRSGYTMTGGMTCGVNGQWSPELPTCQPMRTPTQPPHKETKK